MLEPGTTGVFMLLAGCRKTDSAFHGVTSLSSEEHVPLQDGVICTRNHKSILLKRGGEALAFFRITVSFSLGWRSRGVGCVMLLMVGSQAVPCLVVPSKVRDNGSLHEDPCTKEPVRSQS